jgi:putative phosphoribosyl transferase
MFADRKDAGIRLARALEKDYKNKNVLVLGIPRGGVEVAYYVAKFLNGELSVAVAKKLPYPGQPELACGAVAEDGSVYLSALGKRLPEKTVDYLVEQQREEIARRVYEYRHGKPLPHMKDRMVLVVDDGIATGSTVVPLLKLCRAANVARLVVAAPVSGDHYSREIDELADEVIVLEVPDDYYAVGQVYQDFHGFTDDEVMKFLDSSGNEQK